MGLASKEYILLTLKFFKKSLIDSPLCAPTSKKILKLLKFLFLRNLNIFFDKKNQKNLVSIM